MPPRQKLLRSCVTAPLQLFSLSVTIPLAALQALAIARTRQVRARHHLRRPWLFTSI